MQGAKREVRARTFRGVRERVRKYASADIEERGGAPWVVSGIGVVLAGLSLWYLIVFKALSLSGGLSAPDLVLKSLEVLLLGGFSIVLVYAGYWLATTQFDRQKVWWAGLWTMMGLADIVGIVALVQSAQIQSGQPATNGNTAGLLAANTYEYFFM